MLLRSVFFYYVKIGRKFQLKKKKKNNVDIIFKKTTKS